MKYHKQLIKARKKLKLSQQELADLFNVSLATVKMWEAGTRLPSIINRVQIKRYFSERNIYFENFNKDSFV